MAIYKLYLKPEERETLETWVKTGKNAVHKVQRAQILLNSDENVGRVSSTVLSSILKVSVKTIERVRREFCEEGMSMFEPKLRQTRSDKKIDGRVEAHLTALLCQSPPDNRPKWELRMLADTLVSLEVVEHISVTMISRLLKKTNLNRFKKNSG